MGTTRSHNFTLPNVLISPFANASSFAGACLATSRPAFVLLRLAGVSAFVCGADTKLDLLSPPELSLAPPLAPSRSVPQEARTKALLSGGS